MAPNKAPANQRLLACQMCWLPLRGSWHRAAMTERVVLKIPSLHAAVKASRCDLISHILHPVSDSFSQLPDTIETVPRRCGRSAPSEPFPLRKEVTSMDNENKWEYDYSSEHSQTGETGYPNVGSSGMNTANTAGTYGEAAQAAPQAEPNGGSDGGAVPPPEGPGISRTGKPQAASQKAPPEKRQYRPQCSRAGAGRSHGLCRRLCGSGWATQAARWSSSRWHLPPRPAVIPALPPQ